MRLSRPLSTTAFCLGSLLFSVLGACATGDGEVSSEEGSAVRAKPDAGAVPSSPSCTGEGPGRSDCGPRKGESCCASLPVEAGSFHRGPDKTSPATLAAFRLDKFEVTVGRFRQFVGAWVGGWRPAARAGKHVHLNAGKGLAEAKGAGYEAGWQEAWTDELPATELDWTQALSCDPKLATWTHGPGANERLPQNCLSWFDAAAFCIWDGGFLPSEAEWESAASGGSEERAYPWGAAPPTTDLASYGCEATRALTLGRGGCELRDIEPVGARPRGNGRWGHSDLAGSMSEWTLDWWESKHSPTCENCALMKSSDVRTTRSVRGGGFTHLTGQGLEATARDFGKPTGRYGATGARCARTP